MLELVKLGPNRQRRVFLSLDEVRGDKVFVSALNGRVRDALEEVVLRGQELAGTHSVPPIAVDNAADAAFSGFFAIVTAIEGAVNDRVVTPTPAATAAKRAAGAILLRAFPKGTAFLSLAMPLQHEAMKQVIDRLLRDDACVEAVKLLGLGWLVEHMGAHMGPYGRVVSRGDSRDADAASDAFHSAFRTLALRALDHHEADADIRARLLGAYERELDAQREDERASRKRREKSDATPPDPA